MASARKAEEAFVQQLRAEVPGDGWRLFGGRNWSQLQLAVLGQALQNSVVKVENL